MITLYHSDSSVCAAKVRVTLAEKSLKWESRLLDILKGEQFFPEYLKLNPNGVVPTLVHDGIAIIESVVINEYIEDVFPDPPLRPYEAAERARMRLWTKREDSMHYAINSMTTAIVFRFMELAKSEEEREARLGLFRDEFLKKKWVDLINNGAKSEYFTAALNTTFQLLYDMETTLQSNIWLAGDNYTLADIGLISYFNRLRLLQMDRMWRDRLPRVTDWFERSMGRPTFDDAIMSYIPQEKLRTYKAASDAVLDVVSDRVVSFVNDSAIHTP